MASNRHTQKPQDVVDSQCFHRGLSFPVQSSEDTDVKGFNQSFSKEENGGAALGSLDSGFDSMHTQLLSIHSQLSQTSAYNPADTVNVYNMSHARRGHFVIVNIRKFQPSTKMPERRGTDADAANLYTTFKKLGFDVDIVYDLTCSDMMKLVIDYAARDHTDRDCFALALLTHGDADGVVFGTDATIPIKKLVEPLKSSRTLAGKPKLFFVQACRGDVFDEGVDVTDAEVFTDETSKPAYRLPKEADFIYAYSTAPGFYSFRNSTRGSPFISAVAKVFKEHGSEMDVLRLLTRVNHAVAYDYESKALDPALCRKKQVPSFESMLTKDLYLPSKKK